MLTVYVGCALTHVGQTYRDEVETLKSRLRLDYNVLDFIGPKSGTPRQVWDHDMKDCVGRCHFLLAIADHPSTGLGVEIGLAIGRYEIPVLIVAHNDFMVSRTVIDPGEDNVAFFRYDNLLEDVPRIVQAFVGDTPSLVLFQKVPVTSDFR
jgi:hypothetical protein